MLQDVPDFAERKRLLESLKNKLEALLSTKLVAAFNGHLLGKTWCLYLLLKIESRKLIKSGGTANLPHLANVRDIQSFDKGHQIQGRQEIRTTKRMPVLPGV